MRDVNLHDAIEVSNKLIVPTNCFLVFSVMIIDFPTVLNILKCSPSLRCGGSQRINGFVMMLFPWLISALVTFRSWTRCTKERRLENIEGFPNTSNHLVVGSNVFST